MNHKKRTIDDLYSVAMYITIMVSAVLLFLFDTPTIEIHQHLYVLYLTLLTILFLCSAMCLVSLWWRNRDMELAAVCFLLATKLIVFVEKTIVYLSSDISITLAEYVPHIIISMYMIMFAVFRLFKIRRNIYLQHEFEDAYKQYSCKDKE